MNDREFMRALVVEFIGAFALTFMGAGAIIATGGNDLVAIALAYGLAVGLMVMAAGHISGGHFNPAVTIAMLVTRRMSGARALGYIIAQLAGALAGAGVLVLTFRDIERNAVNLGVPAVGANFNAGNALVAEIVASFFLILVFFGTAVDNRTPKIVSGLCIGLTAAMDVLAVFPVSGAAMNPSRWFGVAIVQQEWSDFWIWWVGPIAGGVLAAVVYNDVLLGGMTMIGRGRAAEAEDEVVVVERTEVAARPRPTPSRRAQRRNR